MSEQASVRERGRRQTLVGTVISNKMDQTAVVQVTRTVTHPLYKRQLKRSAKYAAHDAENACGIGDEVLLESTRPLSRRKRWRVKQILKKSEES